MQVFIVKHSDILLSPAKALLEAEGYTLEWVAPSTTEHILDNCHDRLADGPDSLHRVDAFNLLREVRKNCEKDSSVYLLLEAD